VTGLPLTSDLMLFIFSHSLTASWSTMQFVVRLGLGHRLMFVCS